MKDPAIFCCRREKGLIISAADLEDPSLFDDMEDAGLLKLSPDGLKIEQVLGSTLLTDVEALTPITKDVLDKINDTTAEKTEAKETETETKKTGETAPMAVSAAKAAPVIRTTGGNGMIHIEIDKAANLEGLRLDVPIAAGVPAAVESGCSAEKSEEPASPESVKKVIRTLKKQHIKITEVEIGDETSIKDGKITIDGSIVEKPFSKIHSVRALTLMLFIRIKDISIPRRSWMYVRSQPKWKVNSARA